MKTPEKILKRLEEDKKSKAAANQDFPEKGSSKEPPEFKPKNEEMSDDKKVGKSISNAKKIMKYAHYFDMGLDSFEKIKSSGKALPHLKNLGVNLAKHESKITKVNKAFQSADGISPSGPSTKFGFNKAFSKANKALSIADTGYKSYKALDYANNGEVGLTVKNSADALSAGMGISKNPVALSFHAGYEGMKMINEYTDNAVPDFIYEKSGLQIIGKMKGYEEAKGWRASSSIRPMQLNNLKSIQRTIDMMLSEIQSTENFNQMLVSEISSEFSNEDRSVRLPEFEGEKPDLSILNLEFNDVDLQFDQLYELSIKLENYKNKLNLHYQKLSQLQAQLERKNKKKNKTEIIHSPYSETKNYAKYNEHGELVESGNVTIDEEGKINGGNGIRYFRYNKKGVKIEEGTFDFDKKGKKVNQKSSKLYIY